MRQFGRAIESAFPPGPVQINVKHGRAKVLGNDGRPESVPPPLGLGVMFPFCILGTLFTNELNQG